MERWTYYLGVDGISSAVAAIGKLSFFTILDKKNAQIKCSNEDRMAVGILPIQDPAGAVVFISGMFTPNEMNEIKALAQYEYAPMRDEVSKVAAKTMIDLEKKGLKIPTHILGKEE